MSLEHLVKELSGTNWTDAQELESRLKSSKGRRGSATWHWWDADPDNFGKGPDMSRSGDDDMFGASPIPVERSGVSSSPARTPGGGGVGKKLNHGGQKDKKGKLVGGGQLDENGNPYVWEPLLEPALMKGYCQHPQQSYHADDGEEEHVEQLREDLESSGITVSLHGKSGASGTCRLELYLFDEELVDAEGVLADSKDVALRENEIISVVFHPNSEVEHMGRKFDQMESPAYYLELDESRSTLNFVGGEAPEDALELGDSIEVVLEKCR